MAQIFLNLGGALGEHDVLVVVDLQVGRADDRGQHVLHHFEVSRAGHELCHLLGNIYCERKMKKNLDMMSFVVNAIIS